MKSFGLSYGFFLLGGALLLATSACTPPHERVFANAAAGPGYPVDDRDTLTKEYRPLNGGTLGAPADAEAPQNKTIGNGDLTLH